MGAFQTHKRTIRIADFEHPRGAVSIETLMAMERPDWRICATRSICGARTSRASRWRAVGYASMASSSAPRLWTTITFRCSRISRAALRTAPGMMAAR